MDKPNRLDLMDGTKVIWSVAIYVTSILVAVVLASILDPLLSPLERERTEMSLIAGCVLLVIIGIAGFLAIRAYVYRPILRMYQTCADPDLFWTHCREVGRMALPYAPLFGVPLALLCFDLAGWIMALPLGIMIVFEKMTERLRLKPIGEAVDRLLMQMSTT